MQARKFYLDSQNRAFVGSADSTLDAGDPAFFREDVEGVELYFLEPTGVTPPFRYLDYSANTVKLAVGLTAPAALQTSWTAVSTTITASITSLVTGGDNANDTRKLTLTGRAPVFGGLGISVSAQELPLSGYFQDGPAQEGTFTTSANHGLFDGRQIIFEGWTDLATFSNGVPYFIRNATKRTFQISATIGGTIIPVTEDEETGDIFTIPVSTATIPANELTAANIQRALNEAGLVVDSRPQISVSGSVASGFVFEFIDQMGLTVLQGINVTNTLSAAPGLTANLSFNTNEVAALITAGTTTGLRMEVEVSDGTKRQTYATSASVSPDIITSSSPAPVPTGTPATSFNLIAPNSDVWNVTIDNDGVLTATKQ